jgi:hypothetical protein
MIGFPTATQPGAVHLGLRIGVRLAGVFSDWAAALVVGGFLRAGVRFTGDFFLVSGASAGGG